MIYNISNFIIVQDLNGDEKLVYSTLSTSMIVLQRNIYMKMYFCLKDLMNMMIYAKS